MISFLPGLSLAVTTFFWNSTYLFPFFPHLLRHCSFSEHLHVLTEFMHLYENLKCRCFEIELISKTKFCFAHTYIFGGM